MKQLAIIISVVSLVIFSSCEKVISIDLENVAARLVIEGIVDDSGNPTKVTIGKSSVFSANNSYPKVSGAAVKIIDDLGNMFLLTEAKTGTYTNASLTGVIGRTYHLIVTLEGKTYTASSTITRKAKIDSLVIDDNAFGSGLGGSDSKKWIGVSYADPIGFGDNAQVVQTINGRHDRMTHVADDFYSDGGSTQFFITTGKIKLNAGDTVVEELRFVDKGVYRYLSGIQNLADGNTIPENPNSNISGNVLGFFSAHSSQKKQIIIR
ncbi:MAG: hypothetical protein JWP81_4870 [Ferruginibacter sp.]|nr:hypothetical protein [Ferruginibacter sp.]